MRTLGPDLARRSVVKIAAVFWVDGPLAAMVRPMSKEV